MLSLEVSFLLAIFIHIVIKLYNKIKKCTSNMWLEGGELEIFGPITTITGRTYSSKWSKVDGEKLYIIV